MYNIDLIYNTKFQNDFCKLKSNPKTKEVFCFLEKYFSALEDNKIDEKYIFDNYNPLDTQKKTKAFVKLFNTFCLDFLVKMASYKNDDKTVGDACACLGVVYELGLFGLSINKKNALNYLIVSAKLKSEYGTYRLAQFYEKELMSEKVNFKSIYFYRCAAKLGSVAGMHTYGSILVRGDLGAKKEIETGLFYLKAASQMANTSYPHPYYDIGQIFESQNTFSDIDADDDYAYKMYNRGAELGCSNCQYRLGKCYELGQLFKSPNMALALEYYKKAAENGHIDAQYLMSKYYFTGIENVLEVNYPQSFVYAILSGVKGHPEGAYSVGEFFENGYGVKKNLILSLWWYSISNSLGYTKANLKVSELRRMINLKNIGPSHQRMRICFFC